MPRIAVASDITYVRSGEGFEYLCVVKDVVSGEILGEIFSGANDKEACNQGIFVDNGQISV